RFAFGRAAARVALRALMPRPGVTLRASPPGLVLQQREAERLAALEVSAGDPRGERADPEDVALPLGHRDRAARIEQVEGVRGLQHLLVRGEREPGGEEALTLALVILEMPEERWHVGALEVIGRLLGLVLFEDVAVGDRSRGTLREHDVVSALD